MSGEPAQLSLLDEAPPKPAAWEEHNAGKRVTAKKKATKPLPAPPTSQPSTPTRPQPWPSEADVLAMAQRGEVPPIHASQASLRAWVVEVLAEAEGRALEFDHVERADRFRAAIDKVSA